MRIVIFTQFFPPEIGATQTRLETFAAGLARRGHDVEVIGEVPNHPQGVVHEGFTRRPVVRRSADGYKVIHVWVHATPNKTPRTRLAFYGSYAAMAALVGATRPKPDVILASSPPLPVAAAAAAVAARHRVPWVMDVRDLWPAAAVALGELSNPHALRAAERLERRLYASAAAITVVTRPFEQAVAAKSPVGKRIMLVPNGTTQFWLDGAELSVDRSDLGLPETGFLWTYAGNVGAAQGLDAAVEAAGLLGEGFRLLILGDGPARAALEQRAESLPRGSIMFRNQVTPEDARRFLRASDALLVSLANDPILTAFVPSKLFDYCAVGRPVVVAAAGEPEKLVTGYDAALAVLPGDAPALADAVRRLALDPALRTRLVAAGRSFAQLHQRATQVEQVSALLETTASLRS